MLTSNGVMLHTFSLFSRIAEYIPSRWGETSHADFFRLLANIRLWRSRGWGLRFGWGRSTGRARRLAGSLPCFLKYPSRLAADFFRVNIQPLEYVDGNALILAQQAKQ